MARIECCYQKVASYLTGRSHSFAHIIIPLTENFYLRLEKTDYWLGPNSLAFVAPNTFHRVICTERFVYFNIPGDLIRQSDILILRQEPIFNVTPEMENLVKLISYEADCDTSSDELRYLFFYLYAKLIKRNKLPAIQYIEDHYASEINISDLAKLEDYNTAYFTVWFRQKMGVTPSAYIQNYRIDKAKEFLINTTYQISEIANQVGYMDASSFTRAFKSIVGTAPQKYRADNQCAAEFSKMPYWEE